MKTTLLLLSLLISYLAPGQGCNCPNKGFGNPGKPLKIFSFTNAKKIELCGYCEVKNNDTTYGGFALVQCGHSNLIKEWGELFGCKVSKVDDSLFIKEISWLPIGENFTAVPIPFFVHRYSFKGPSLNDTTFYRSDIPKYTELQIRKIFERYKKLSKGNHEETTKVANMLFWAYVSGSKEAELSLRSIPAKFGPFDGVVAEEWDIVSRNYQGWKTKNNHK